MKTEVKFALLILAFCRCGGQAGGEEHDPPCEGCVAEECTAGYCTATSDCESSYHCNFAVDTGQEGRGVCQSLGCGPQGSVCDADALCTGALLCNDFYRDEKEPSEEDESLAWDGVPLQPQCRPGALEDPCSEDEDCAGTRSCNDLYDPPECRSQTEGDLCRKDSDCEQPDEGPEHVCNEAYFDCFDDPWDFDCEVAPGTKEAVEIGRCVPIGDLGSPCMDDYDCLDDGHDYDDLHCVRHGLHVESGKCYDSYGYSSQRCHGDGDCSDEGFCVEQPGACGVGLSEGSSCDNDSECGWGLDCEDGECA
ncbi:MAG: hypothetical protein ABIK09_15090 [Pseudomonadota bacterium]